MNRGYFFLLMVFLIFFLPNALAQEDSCFSSDSEGFVPHSNFATDVDAKFFYEGVPTAYWNFRINPGGTAEVMVLDTVRLDSQRQETSIANCQYYTLDYIRPATELSYDLPLLREEIVDNFRKCLYTMAPFYDEIATDLLVLGGQAISFDDICPDLRQGRSLAEGTEVCPQTAECLIDVSQGTREKFGYTLSADSCENYIIEEDNNGLPIHSSQVPLRIQDFKASCLTRLDALSGTEDINSESTESSSNWVIDLFNAIFNTLFNIINAIFQAIADFFNPPEDSSSCGNDVLDAGEDCDGNLFVESNDTCSEVNPKYTSGELGCSDSCVIKTDECKRDVRGLIQVDVSVKAGVWPITKTMSGKAIADLRVTGGRDNGPADEVRYTLRTEGAETFEGAYSFAMDTLRSLDPKTWNAIMVKGNGGTLGPGIIYTTQSDGLTVNQVISTDLAVHTLLGNVLDEGKHYKTNEIVLEMIKKEDGYDSSVFQEIKDSTDRNKILFSSTSGFDLTDSEANDILVELLGRFSSYSSTSEGSSETVNGIPVVNTPDLIDKINNGNFNSGTKLKQLTIGFRNVFADKTSTYTIVDIQQLIDYLSTFVRSSASAGGEIFGDDTTFGFEESQFA